MTRRAQRLSREDEQRIAEQKAAEELAALQDKYNTWVATAARKLVLSLPRKTK